MTDFKGNEVKKNMFLKKKSKMEDSKKMSNSDNSQYFFQKFHGFVLGLLGLIDAKDIDLA